MKSPDPRQHHLPLDPPALDLDRELRAALSEAIEQCGKTRDEIAEHMSRLAGRPITKAQLDAWTAGSKKAWAFPAALLPAFIQATTAPEVLELLASALGLRVMTEDAWNLAELGRVVAEQHRLGRQRRLQERKLGVRR
jgi:hypothetical protein